MRIEQISIHASATTKLFRVNRRQCLLQQQIRAVTITQPRPQVDLPREAPACSHIAAQFQTLPCRGEKVRRAAVSNLIAREQSVKMRDVPVLPLRSFEIPVVEPLLQLTRFPDLHQRQT